MLQLVKLHRRGQLCLCRHLRRIFPFVTNRPVDLRAGIDGQRVSFHPDPAAHFAGNAQMLAKNQQISPQAAVERQVLHKDRHTPAHLRRGFEVHRLVKGQYVFADVSPDGQRVRKRSNVSVHLPIDLQLLRKADDIAFDVPADRCVVSK